MTVTAPGLQVQWLLLLLLRSGHFDLVATRHSVLHRIFVQLLLCWQVLSATGVKGPAVWASPYVSNYFIIVIILNFFL